MSEKVQGRKSYFPIHRKEIRQADYILDERVKESKGTQTFRTSQLAEERA